MPGPMPYYLEKGPAMSIIEAFVNTPGTRLEAALTKLRATNPDGSYTHRLVECGAFDSKSLVFDQPASNPNDPPTHWTVARWKNHMNLHWFGIIDGAGKPKDPADADRLSEASSWWINYFGADVEGILRQTIIRAVETAYRIEHGDPLPPVTPTFQPWPIELFWKCGQAWFEGWVTWRQLPGPGDRGLVTTIVCTPAENTGNHYLWWSPIPNAGDLPGRSDPYDKGVDKLGRDGAGMVVVTHEHNRPTTVPVSRIPAQMKGQLAPPSPGAV